LLSRRSDTLIVDDLILTGALNDICRHGKIQREGGVPITAGEHFHSIYEFENMIASGGVSFPKPDLATLTGIAPLMKVAKGTEAKNLPAISHVLHDLRVDVLAAVPNTSYLHAHNFGVERYIEHPLEIVDGCASVPNRPSHGIALGCSGLEVHWCR
jgi:L-alanine-DL-glutamate epimerase-like enolase superfamily enzyme